MNNIPWDVLTSTTSGVVLVGLFIWIFLTKIFPDMIDTFKEELKQNREMFADVSKQQRESNEKVNQEIVQTIKNTGHEMAEAHKETQSTLNRLIELAVRKDEHPTDNSD